jgi:hypothetical protein
LRLSCACFAGNVLQDEAFIYLEGVVTKSTIKPARNLLFIEVEAAVEALSVLHETGMCAMLHACTIPHSMTIMEAWPGHICQSNC